MTTLQSLKDDLSHELEQADIDYGKILALAGEIAKLDEENIRFSVDASHVFRLGMELVSRQETAVAELTKNAYDADATEVKIVFKNSAAPGGELIVSDNGDGMSRDQLINGFMRISTQEKVARPTSSSFGRQRAGRKGIGRFAAQRLGTKVLISTQKAREDFSLQIEIDWNSFKGGRDLILVSNQIKKGPKLSQQGTTLQIFNLRDAWSEAQIQRTFRFVSELMQPFPLTKISSHSKIRDPGFKAEFSRWQKGESEIIASEEQSIFSHALATISGEVDNQGTPKLHLLSEKYKIKILDRKLAFDHRVKARTGLSIERYSELSGVRFTAHYFITDELPQGTRSLAREILNRQGGIRVYRNGFRVLPYGEAFDDWLGLQRSSALRSLIPPHHNTNFLGFVEIRDLDGVRFEETASREGLIENAAFVQLQDFVYRALMMGVIELAQARSKRVFAGEAKKPASTTRFPRAKAAELANALRTVAEATKPIPQTHNDREDTTSTPGGIQDFPVANANKINQLANEVEELGEQSQEYLEENGMLRVLASLGLTIGEFTHEVRHSIAALSATSTLIRNEVKSSGSLALHSKSMHENIELLRSYVRYFDHAVTQNAHRELTVHELRDLVNEFTAVVKPTLDRQKINIESKFNGYDLFTRPMHKSEWASIFLNLFTNAIKAIHRSGNKGRILIEVGVIDDHLYIDFSDTGDGIPIENRSKIFDAFFTTSIPADALSPDSEKLVGTGLGLKIVRDTIEGVDGEIEVIAPVNGYATTLRIIIPQAKDEEIGDAKY